MKLGKSRAVKAMEAALEGKGKKKNAKSAKKNKAKKKGNENRGSGGNLLGVLYSFFLFIYTLIMNFVSVRHRLNKEELQAALGEKKGHLGRNGNEDDEKEGERAEQQTENEDEGEESGDEGGPLRGNARRREGRAGRGRSSMLQEDTTDGDEDAWLPRRQRRGIFI